jgi:hypothetical protein
VEYFRCTSRIAGRGPQSQSWKTPVANNASVGLIWT